MDGRSHTAATVVHNCTTVVHSYTTVVDNTSSSSNNSKINNIKLTTTNDPTLTARLATDATCDIRLEPHLEPIGTSLVQRLIG